MHTFAPVSYNTVWYNTCTVYDLGVPLHHTSVSVKVRHEGNFDLLFLLNFQLVAYSLITSGLFMLPLSVRRVGLTFFVLMTRTLHVVPQAQLCASLLVVSPPCPFFSLRPLWTIGPPGTSSGCVGALLQMFWTGSVSLSARLSLPLCSSVLFSPLWEKCAWALCLMH